MFFFTVDYAMDSVRRQMPRTVLVDFYNDSSEKNAN